MNQEPTILSNRLELQHISSNELIELSSKPDSFFLYKLRAPMVQENYSHNKWFFRRIFIKKSTEYVGQISFHLPPDDLGMIEIGLDIEEEYRNQGFATEALLAMWSWAVAQPEVRVLRYTVSSMNHPSMRIIQKFGFTHVGQQIDEEDGPEEIFEMSADIFRERFTKSVN